MRSWEANADRLGWVLLLRWKGSEHRGRGCPNRTCRVLHIRLSKLLACPASPYRLVRLAVKYIDGQYSLPIAPHIELIAVIPSAPTPSRTIRCRVRLDVGPFPRADRKVDHEIGCMALF